MAPTTNRVDTYHDLRSDLTTRREQLIAAVGAFDAEHDGASERPVGTHGETEHLSLSEQQGVDGAIESMQRRALAEIDAALARMDDGTYGTCHHCGTTIPRERLEAIPETDVCVACG